MKTIAVIPARLHSTRLPRKMLRKLGSHTLIERTYLNLEAMGVFDKLLVATDAVEIKEALKHTSAEVFMSLKPHDCGSDRIAEAVENEPAEIIVNVQGDEPFVRSEDLAKLVGKLKDDASGNISLASLMHSMDKPEDIDNPNNVKVVTDFAGRALYFSRSPIPYDREKTGRKVFKHVGVYAFRKRALMDFYRSSMGLLEDIEKIECLRYLENGHTIQMIEIDCPSLGIDTEEDLAEARKLI